MHKFIVLLKRKPGTTQEEFINHYNNVHVTLAKKLFPRLVKKHIRNFPTNEIDAPYDAICEIWCESEQYLKEFIHMREKDPENEKLKILYEDELKFLDVNQIIFVPVNEFITDFTAE